MSELRLNVMMSLDGYVAGPEQSEENPFGIGGMRVNEWLLPLEVFREMQGEKGGEVNASPGRRGARRHPHQIPRLEVEEERPVVYLDTPELTLRGRRASRRRGSRPRDGLPLR
jgi:hypothetical protein